MEIGNEIETTISNVPFDTKHYAFDEEASAEIPTDDISKQKYRLAPTSAMKYLTPSQQHDAPNQSTGTIMKLNDDAIIPKRKQ